MTSNSFEQSQSPRKIGKIVLWVGSTLVLLAVCGAGTVTPGYASYTAYYYSAAVGLSLIVGGLLSFVD